jgi:hypothetical protein
MIFRRITLNACLALLVVSNSAAAPLRNFKVGGWLAGAYSNDSTGEFSHCAASAAYGSGISVFFAISKDFTWRMSFSKPEWKLSTGAAYDIAFTVDNMPPVVSRAVAVGSNQVVVALNDSSDLFQRFRRGFVLSVAAADQVFRFNLTGTSQLLPVLLRCAMQNGNPQIAQPCYCLIRPVCGTGRSNNLGCESAFASRHSRFSASRSERPTKHKSRCKMDGGSTIRDRFSDTRHSTLAA